MRRTREEKAITLIALIITIVVLLILAVVAINAVTGDGIIQHAVNAKTDYEKAQAEEETILGSYLDKLDIETAETILMSEVKSGEKFERLTKVKDSSGNVLIVPKGFAIIKEEATHVSKGIVIEDCTEEATDGSQFVWIPVGKVIKEDKTEVQIELGRYLFADGTTTYEEGVLEKGKVVESMSHKTPSGQLKRSLTEEGRYFTEGLKNSNTINAHAKDIEEFISSAKNNGGYYIGRYEARTSVVRSAMTDQLTQLTTIATEDSYNYITQIQASELSINMYDNNTKTKVISDLINSYAWDTAILFIQEMEDSDYSRQTTITEGVDKGCNIYDMASKCYELSTESSNTEEYPCVARGAMYNISATYTSLRNAVVNSFGDKGAHFSFRPILYI